MRRVRSLQVILLPWVLQASLSLLPGQSTSPSPTASPQAQDSAAAKSQAELKRRVETLELLLRDVQTRERELLQARAAATAATNTTERIKTQVSIMELEADVQKLTGDFQSLATGIALDEYDQGSLAKVQLLDEVASLLRPLVQELKESTQDLRQTAQLRAMIEAQAKRRLVAQQAIDSLTRFDSLGGGVAPGVRDRLRALRDQWSRRLTSARSHESVATHQLQTRLNNREPLLDSTRKWTGEFLQTRGLHISLALAAFLAVLLGLRFIARPFRCWAHRRREAGDGRGVYLRVFSVLFHSFVFLFAMIAALGVLYAADDWGLLGLALLILLGLAWQARETLPRFLDQIRLLLDIGAVREGERIVLQGVPWCVGRINLFTKLTNPELSGSLRVPIKELISLQSRPIAQREAWFPCETGNWVILSDDTRGKVVEQGIDFVRIVQVGGAQITYQTPAFLALNPKNISANFSVSETFGVAYEHQAICTTEIPQTMQDRLQKDMFEMLGEDLLNVGVYFKAAAASSLDYAILVDVRGAAASRYAAIHREIQGSLVETCSHEDWGIPFTQVTVHQAAS